MQPLGSTTRPHLCAFAWACFGSFVKDFMNHQFRLEAANLPPGRQMRWNDHASTLELPQSEVPVGGAVPTVGIFVSLALQRAQAGAAPSALSAAAPDTVDTTCTVWRTFTDEHGTATSQDAIRRHITAQARCVLGLSAARRLLRRHFLRWWSARVRACVDGVGCTAWVASRKCRTGRTARAANSWFVGALCLARAWAGARAHVCGCRW
jgi:hypothetical protein